MKLHGLAFFAILFLASSVFSQAAPAADHHQHLFSPEIVKLLTTPSGAPTQILASDVIVGDHSSKKFCAARLRLAAHRSGQAIASRAVSIRDLRRTGIAARDHFGVAASLRNLPTYAE